MLSEGANMLMLSRYNVYQAHNLSLACQHLLIGIKRAAKADGSVINQSTDCELYLKILKGNSSYIC